MLFSYHIKSSRPGTLGAGAGQVEVHAVPGCTFLMALARIRFVWFSLYLSLMYQYVLTGCWWQTVVMWLWCAVPVCSHARSKSKHLQSTGKRPSCWKSLGQKKSRNWRKGKWLGLQYFCWDCLLWTTLLQRFSRFRSSMNPYNGQLLPRFISFFQVRHILCWFIVFWCVLETLSAKVIVPVAEFDPNSAPFSWNGFLPFSCSKNTRLPAPAGCGCPQIRQKRTVDGSEIPNNYLGPGM